MPTAPPTFPRLLAWHPQPVPVFVVGCAVAAACYGLGVWRLRRRGDAWPVGRAVAWCLGLASVLLVTATGVGGYGMELVSVHMVQHMVLSMVSPILLLLGAPITLALRALPTAPRGRRGPREILVSLLHSRFVQVLASPFVTLPLFIATLYGLYFTPLFEVLMRSWWGHTAMLVHFLAVGLLFFWPILGIDPAPRRPGHLLRLLELFAGMPFHAFFGVAVMMSTSVLFPVFAHPPPAWGTNPLSDQNTAGGIAWAFAELPTLLVLAAVYVQWLRTEHRQAARRDRATDRYGDRELDAYNAYLAALNQPRRSYTNGIYSRSGPGGCGVWGRVRR